MLTSLYDPPTYVEDDCVRRKLHVRERKLAKRERDFVSKFVYLISNEFVTSFIILTFHCVTCLCLEYKKEVFHNKCFRKKVFKV